MQNFVLFGAGEGGPNGVSEKHRDLLLLWRVVKCGAKKKNSKTKIIAFVVRFCPFRKRPRMLDRTYGPVRINFGRQRIKVAVAHFLFGKGQRSSCIQNFRAKFDIRRCVGVGAASLQLC